MTASAPTSPTLVCDILAANSTLAASIADIAIACARDVAQPLTVRKRTPAARPGGADNRETLLTLHLPAALAASQHPVWCLACRLACFCPSVRVSVLVECEAAFSRTRRVSRRAA